MFSGANAAGHCAARSCADLNALSPPRLLGALCRCICDPRINSGPQEIRPAESLAQLLLFHLNSKSALQRIAVAMVLCEWGADQKVGLCMVVERPVCM